MLKSAIKVFSFINETLLRNTKEDSVVKVGVATILLANIKHKLRTKAGVEMKLVNPNNTLQFPLPNRWTHPDYKMSMQQTYMVIKQVGLNLKKAGINERNIIDQYPDRSYSAINVMGLLNTVRVGQMEMVEKVRTEFNVLSQVKYTRERQLLFADGLVNGQHSYQLRKYSSQYFQLQSSKPIDQLYRKTLQQSLQTQLWNDNPSIVGLTKEEIIRRIKNNQGVYSMMFEHLQNVCKGGVLTKNPTIYIDNQKLDEQHYLHVPYPVFMRVTEKTKQTRFVCIAIGTRFKGQSKPRIFSPFFANQGEKVWRLMQSHLGQTIINDFSVRVHLGIYHFTTNQYHVPMYKLVNTFKDTQNKAYIGFLDHTYSLFSRGLQGVNVAATASLVHQFEQYSLVNKVFNIKQDDAITIIAQTSNNVKIFEYDPINILRKQGIDQKQVGNYFDKLNFDIQLYGILSRYIEKVYNAFRINEFDDKLFAEINHQTKFMAVGPSTPRPSLRTREDVLKTIQNLCFCWVGFHSHTFSTISLATYAHFRPSMLKTQIPANSKEWANLQVGQQLPDSKIIMETGKLNEATTQRDSDNFLFDNIRRQADQAAFKAKENHNNAHLREAYQKVQQAAHETLTQLRAYEQAVIKKNEQRRKQHGSVVFEWMVPSKIQTSLNI